MNVFELERKLDKEIRAPSFEECLEANYENQIFGVNSKGEAYLTTGEEIFALLEEKEADLAVFQPESFIAADLAEIAEELGVSAEGEYIYFERVKKEEIKNLPKGLPQFFFILTP